MSSASSTSIETLPARPLNVEGGAAPEWIELIPAGPQVAGLDGRSWSNPDPAALIAATRDYGRPLPIDWEHATDVRAPQGLDAPAAGWIEPDALEARDGSIWGRVAWTPRAAEQVVNREYRFISPMFLHDRAGKITRLEGGGLTNTPNLRLRALNRRSPHSETETSLDLASRIRAALGLPEAATEDALVLAVTTAQTRATNSAQPDLTKYAPRADLERATNRVKELETAAATREAAERDGKIEAVLDKAKLDGKIAPASVEEYRAMCRAEGGLESFTKLVATLPVLASGQRTTAAKKPTGDGAQALTDEERAVCRALGQTEEAFLIAKKEAA